MNLVIHEKGAFKWVFIHLCCIRAMWIIIYVYITNKKYPCVVLLVLSRGKLPDNWLWTRTHNRICIGISASMCICLHLSVEYAQCSYNVNDRKFITIPFGILVCACGSSS